MEKDKKFRALAIAAICVAVVGVSVAYAALATTLSINGTATVDTGSAWNIAWVSVTDPTAPAEGDTVTKADSSISFGENGQNKPIIAGNKITWTATFTAPNTSFTFKAKIKNAGTLGAKLLDGTYVTKAGDDANNFEYTVTVDGVNISSKSGAIIAGGQNIEKELVITVKLKDMDNATFEGLNSKTVTFNLALPFEQAADGEVNPVF